MLRVLSVVLHCPRVPHPPTDQVAVDGERGHPRDREREGEAAPEEEAVEPGVHRAGDQEEHAVVDDLHHRDRHRVGRECDPDRTADGKTRAQEGPQREGVPEDIRECDRERDRRRVLPAELLCDDEPEDLADRAARQAVVVAETAIRFSDMA